MLTNTSRGSSQTTTQTATTTSTVQDEDQLPNSATLRLKKKKKRVNWRTDTVDNEGMGKKSSKCCCIYKKPHSFGESSSDSEADDCDHCRGHVEKRPTVNAEK